MGVVAGATYTVDQLFYGLFLSSGNDAASALANAAGGWAPTVAADERRGRASCRPTTPRRSTRAGWTRTGQVTSAYDLALFARAGLTRPGLPGLRLHQALRLPRRPGQDAGGPGAATFQIQNQNRLLMHGYPGIVGVKTGYTSLAGRTYVAAAERGGHLIIVTLMRIAGPSEDAAPGAAQLGVPQRRQARGRHAGRPPARPVGRRRTASAAAGVAGRRRRWPAASGSGLGSHAWLGVGLGAALARRHRRAGLRPAPAPRPPQRRPDRRRPPAGAPGSEPAGLRRHERPGTDEQHPRETYEIQTSSPTVAANVP